MAIRVTGLTGANVTALTQHVSDKRLTSVRGTVATFDATPEEARDIVQETMDAIRGGRGGGYRSLWALRKKLDEACLSGGETDHVKIVKDANGAAKDGAPAPVLEGLQVEPAETNSRKVNKVESRKWQPSPLSGNNATHLEKVRYMSQHALTPSAREWWARKETQLTGLRPVDRETAGSRRRPRDGTRSLPE